MFSLQNVSFYLILYHLYDENHDVFNDYKNEYINEYTKTYTCLRKKAKKYRNICGKTQKNIVLAVDFD